VDSVDVEIIYRSIRAGDKRFATGRHHAESCGLTVE